MAPWHVLAVHPLTGQVYDAGSACANVVVGLVAGFETRICVACAVGVGSVVGVGKGAAETAGAVGEAIIALAEATIVAAVGTWAPATATAP